MREIRDKPTLFVDLDDTVFELVIPLLDTYNRKYNNTCNNKVKYSDIKSWEIHNYLSAECVNIFEEFCDSNFIYNTAPIEQSIETLNKLHEYFTIVFLTASHPCLGTSRHEKLKKYFKWYDYRSNLIITANKKLCSGFALIDDGYHNLQNNNSVHHRIVMNRPWNESQKSEDISSNIIRASNWNDIYHILMFLLNN